MINDTEINYESQYPFDVSSLSEI